MKLFFADPLRINGMIQLSSTAYPECALLLRNWDDTIITELLVSSVQSELFKHQSWKRCHQLF